MVHTISRISQVVLHMLPNLGIQLGHEHCHYVMCCIPNLMHHINDKLIKCKPLTQVLRHFANRHI